MKQPPKAVAHGILLVIMHHRVVTYNHVKRSFEMETSHALTFALAVSFSSMAIIVGAALMGAYKFLKNIGVFKGHYYY